MSTTFIFPSATKHAPLVISEAKPFDYLVCIGCKVSFESIPNQVFEVVDKKIHLNLDETVEVEFELSEIP